MYTFFFGNRWMGAHVLPHCLRASNELTYMTAARMRENFVYARRRWRKKNAHAWNWLRLISYSVAYFRIFISYRHIRWWELTISLDGLFISTALICFANIYVGEYVELLDASDHHFYIKMYFVEFTKQNHSFKCQDLIWSTIFCSYLKKLKSSKMQHFHFLKFRFKWNMPNDEFCRFHRMHSYYILLHCHLVSQQQLGRSNTQRDFFRVSVKRKLLNQWDSFTTPTSLEFLLTSCCTEKSPFIDKIITYKLPMFI